MPFAIGYDASGLDPKARMVIDAIVATLQVGINNLATVPTGAILRWPLTTAPTGYLLADGAAVSRETYGALFQVIGVTSGVGNGTSTFTLPTVADSIIKT